MNSPLTQQELQEAYEFLSKKADFPLQAGIILGSGLGDLADLLERKISVPFHEIPHFPASGVAGHKGVFHFGFLDNVAVAVMQGRVHYYEGNHPSRVTIGVRLMALLGVRSLIVTNAAGAVNPNFKPGDLMLITDHLNLTGANALLGAHVPEWGERFVDMSEAYSQQLLSYAREVGEAGNIILQEGVYCAMSGPTYETPAEVRMIQRLGGDAVGMSTVYEVMAARQMDMRVLGVSLISNMGAGILQQPLNHEEVMETAARRKTDFINLIRGVIFLIDKE